MTVFIKFICLVRFMGHQQCFFQTFIECVSLQVLCFRQTNFRPNWLKSNSEQPPKNSLWDSWNIQNSLCNKKRETKNLNTRRKIHTVFAKTLSVSFIIPLAHPSSSTSVWKKQLGNPEKNICAWKTDIQDQKTYCGICEYKSRNYFFLNLMSIA